MNRRKFVKQTAIAGTTLGILSPSILSGMQTSVIKIGIIGLDTSHATAFAKIFNAADSPKEFQGFRVVAAYPKGSADIESSVSRIPKYTEEVKGYGVEIVDSVKSLLKMVDVVLLETNDGRPHKEQAFEVLKAGKPMFIDKPVAASLKDVLAIYDEARKRKVPIFSASSLRYMQTVQQVRYENKIGRVIGADTFSPATLEPTHPDLFWYGIHGVETLFTVMGPGCESVIRQHSPNMDVVVGKWKDGRIGTFRGTREGKHDYGGTAYGTEGNLALGPFDGYDGLAIKIAEFFRSGKPPFDEVETLEIYAFMEAADESKRRNGATVNLKEVIGDR
ncbi:MAG: Gfo/Idh/MocA family oxidoreductase [Cyclobacteriaceae bacterium]